MFKFNVTALIAAMQVCGFVYAGDNAAKAITVKIAHISPLTGWRSDYGIESVNGAKMAIDDANKKGISIDGVPVRFELVVRDDEGTSKKAVAIANELSSKGDITAVVGHFSSGPTIASAPIYAENNIIQISPNATNPIFTQKSFPLAFRTITNDEQQGNSIAEYVLNNLHGKNIVTVAQSNAYALGIAKTFENTIKLNDGKIGLKLETSGKEMDVLYQVPKIKKANPDVIVFMGLDYVFAPYALALRKIGVDVPIVLTDGGCTNEFLEAVKDGDYHCSRNGFALEERPLWPDFSEVYKKTYGVLPKNYAAYSYDAVKAIVMSIEEGKTVSSTAIASQMHQLKVFGVSGTFSFDEHGDIEKGPVSFYSSQGGGWAFNSSIKYEKQSDTALAGPVDIEVPFDNGYATGKPHGLSRGSFLQVSADGSYPVNLKIDKNFDSYVGLAMFKNGATELNKAERNKVVEISGIAKASVSVCLKGRVGKRILTESDRMLAVGRGVAVKQIMVENGVAPKIIKIIQPSNNNLLDNDRKSKLNRSVEIQMRMPDGKILTYSKAEDIEICH